MPPVNWPRLYRGVRARLGWAAALIGLIKLSLDTWSRGEILKEWASDFPAIARFLGEPWVSPTIITVGLGVVVWAALDRGGAVGLDNLRFLPEHYRQKRVPHEYIVGGAIVLCLFAFGLVMHKRVVNHYQVQLQENIRIGADAVGKVRPPEVLLFYQNKRIEIHNPGPATLYLWGGAYGNSKVPLDSSPPRVIVTGAYYYLFMDSFESQLRTALARKAAAEGTTSFHAFVTTEESKKYTIRGILLGKMADGSLSVHTQILPTVEGWNDDPY